MPTNATCRACARAKRLSTGASTTQPPHHDPQTFTNTGRLPNWFSETCFPVMTSGPAIRGFGGDADAPPADRRSAAVTHASTRRFAARAGGDTPPRVPGERSDMAQLVADYVLKRLTEWNVHRIFGYPGDGINGFLGALDRGEGDPEFIQVRHEEMSAVRASAFLAVSALDIALW